MKGLVVKVQSFLDTTDTMVVAIVVVQWGFQGSRLLALAFLGLFSGVSRVFRAQWCNTVS